MKYLLDTSNNNQVEIWNRFRKGDDEAFSKLFQIFSESLYQYGIKFVSDEAMVKDCIQDLFIKIYKNRSNLSDTGNPRFYLFKALKNMIIDALRANRMVHIPPHELVFHAEFEFLPDDDQDAAIKEKFEKVINLLSPRQKEAIYLKYQKEMSNEEIAQLLQINYQSVRNLIHRAIEKIRAEMNWNLFLFLFTKHIL